MGHADVKGRCFRRFPVPVWGKVCKHATVSNSAQENLGHLAEWPEVLVRQGALTDKGRQPARGQQQRERTPDLAHTHARHLRTSGPVIASVRVRPTGSRAKVSRPFFVTIVDVAYAPNRGNDSPGQFDAELAEFIREFWIVLCLQPDCLTRVDVFRAVERVAVAL